MRSWCTVTSTWFRPMPRIGRCIRSPGSEGRLCVGPWRGRHEGRARDDPRTSGRGSLDSPADTTRLCSTPLDWSAGLERIIPPVRERASCNGEPRRTAERLDIDGRSRHARAPPVTRTGRALPSLRCPRRGEDEHHAPDLKRTHNGHLRPAGMVRYQLNVSVIGHRLPGCRSGLAHRRPLRYRVHCCSLWMASLLIQYETYSTESNQPRSIPPTPRERYSRRRRRAPLTRPAARSRSPGGRGRRGRERGTPRCTTTG